MVKFKVLETMESLPAFQPDVPVFIDTETLGLYGKILIIQLYQPQTSENVFIVKNPDTYSIQAILNKYICVFYNASYDLACIFHKKAILPGNLFEYCREIHDLLWLSKQTFLGLDKYSLDNVLKYCGIDLYDEINKKALQKSFKSSDLTDEQFEYAATDVIALHALWDKCNAAKESMAYKVNIKSMLYAIQYQLNGIEVDLDTLNKKLVDINRQIVINNGQLDFNVNSPKQCKEKLGTAKSDEATLKTLMAERNETAELIYKQRRLLKRKTMLESYNYPRVYTRFNVAGAVSSRFTATGQGIYAGINAQQIPRDLKSVFGSSVNKIIEADYSTLELRLAAALYGDNYMYKQLMNGEDLHTSMAQKMTGRMDITKDERTKAKAINFGFVFGMSAKTFVDYAFYNYGVEVTHDEALQIRKEYFNMYRNLAQYHSYIWENYNKPNFYVQTALGWKAKPKLGTDAINIPVQGTGAECTKLAIHYMVKEDPTILQYISNVVHDSIRLEVPKDSSYEKFLEEMMIKAWTELSKSNAFKYKDIPMLVDISVKD